VGLLYLYQISEGLNQVVRGVTTHGVDEKYFKKLQENLKGRDGLDHHIKFNVRKILHQIAT
jgi:hypothetical protein